MGKSGDRDVLTGSFVANRIEFEHVEFRYGRRRPCVVDVTADIGPGATLLVGINGAGKSTLLRIAAGLLRPRGGSVRVTGGVGYLSQVVPRVPGMSVEQQVSYAAWLAGRTPGECRAIAERSLALVGLARLHEVPVRTLSGGEVARMGIACALTADPGVLLLDEPSASLDPIARAEVRLVLDEVLERGVCLLASSHVASDIGRPYNNVLVLDEGRSVYHGSTDEFLQANLTNPRASELARAVRAERQG